MRARWLFSLAILALPLLQGGCSTAATIHSFSGERQVTDHVKKVTHAYRNAGGDVIICAQGWPNDADTDSPAQAFSIVFPAGAFASDTREAPELNKERRALGLPTFAVTTKSILGPCPRRNAFENKPLTPIPVHTIHDTAFGLGYFKHERQDASKRYFDARPMTPAVYQVRSDIECEAEDRLRIVYVHDSSIFDGERVAQVQAGRREIKTGRNYAYLALLPITVAVDLVALVGMFPSYLVTGAIAKEGFAFMPDWRFHDAGCMEEDPAR